MQDKLLAVWDCLQIPTLTRIGFMRKYSSEAYSVEMSRAVDMWAESAVFVVLLQELGKCAKKIMSGLVLMPFQFSRLLSQLKTKVPALLATPSQSLVPLALSDVLQSGQSSGAVGNQTVPLSFSALRRAKRIIEGAFLAQLVDGLSSELSVQDATTAVEVVHSAMEGLATELRSSYKRVSAELDDVVFVGNKSCREWLLLQDLKSNMPTV